MNEVQSIGVFYFSWDAVKIINLVIIKTQQDTLSIGFQANILEKKLKRIVLIISSHPECTRVVKIIKCVHVE